MRVLVLGGTGFLGAPVVTRLSNLGHHVAVYHRGEHEPALPFGVQHFHSPLAALPVASFPPELTELAWDVVLAMSPVGEADSAAVMRTFRGIARRVVALSSGDVYRAHGIFSGREPGPPDPLPLAEDASLRTVMHPSGGAPSVPAHLADDEKILVERAVMGDRDLPGTVLRLPAVFGPGDAQHRFGSFARRIADARSEIVVGRGFAGFRWTHGYVDDVAHAIVLAVVHERARGKIYNVGEENPPTMAERIDAFGRALGWPGRVVPVDEERLPAHLAAKGNYAQPIVYDTSRIRRDLDWTETVSAADAFRRTAAWEGQERGPSDPADAAKIADEYAAEDRAAAESARGAV